MCNLNRDRILDEIHNFLKKKVEKEQEPREVEYYLRKEQEEFAKFLVDLYEKKNAEVHI